MTGALLSVLGVLAAAAVALQPEAGAPDEAAADPCRFGSHGPGAELILDAPPPDYPGYEGEPRPLTVEDPCGLRFTDLSGVWYSDGVQFIAYHDLRTGALALRFMHVPYDSPLFSTWGFRFGDAASFGVIAPDAASVEMYSNLRFPTRLRSICPDEGEIVHRSHDVRLDYDEAGRPRLTRTRMHSHLTVAPCRVRHERFVTSIYVRGEIGAAQ